MSDDHVTITRETAAERREDVRQAARAESNAGWWVAALVAIVAIVGLFFVFGGQRTGDGDLQAARDQGRAEAMLDNATTQAQAAAENATRAASQAADATAAATQAAADSAQAAAQQTAEATQNAAADVSDAASDAAAQEPAVQ